MEDSEPSDIDGQAARPSEWGRASQIRVIRGAFQETEDGGRIGGQKWVEAQFFSPNPTWKFNGFCS